MGGHSPSRGQPRHARTAIAYSGDSRSSLDAAWLGLQPVSATFADVDIVEATYSTPQQPSATLTFRLASDSPDQLPLHYCSFLLVKLAMPKTDSVSPLLRELDVSIVERDVNAYIARHPSLSSRIPTPISLASLHTPSTPLAAAALSYVHSQLDSVMFNHSNRVYYIGQAMAQHLSAPSPSDYRVDSEAYYLTSLFHDLGCAPSHLRATRLSFEFEGALLSHQWILQQSPASVELASEVAEAIARHTNFVQGSMSSTGQLIQLSTTLDVIGANSGLIDRATYGEIEAKWPRLGFNEHFAALMEEEMAVKPWSHTTAVQAEFGFCAKIRGNPYTRQLDAAAAAGK